MNITTDVASSPASNELVSVLARNFVLDGETLIVDALVVYKNGTGCPKAINVATPFLSGTNVRPGRVNPSKSLYEPSTGTYHFEIPVIVSTDRDMDYTFDFLLVVDGVEQQVRLSGAIPAEPEYSLKSLGLEFEGDKLVASYEITALKGGDIVAVASKPTTLVNLSNRTGNGPEVVQKGNQVFLKWNANINNSAEQIFIASGRLNVGTSFASYSFALETKPLSILSSDIAFKDKEIELTFELSEDCQGPFDVSSLGLKENGKVVKTIASVPVIIGKQVKVRLVRTVPTRNKIEYTVKGSIVVVGSQKRSLNFELSTTDFIKVDLPKSPEVLVENISHAFVNGMEKAVFRFTLNDEARTPLINIDGLRLEAPADLSTRNTVDYDSTTGELTVLRSVSNLSGLLTTRGTILAYDYSDEVIEGEFHSSITLEADSYRPARVLSATFNPIVYAGGDTDVGINIPVSMANGEAPADARIKELLSSVNLDTDKLLSRYTYNGNGVIAFQIPATRLDEMVGKTYSLSLLIEIDTPSGISTVPAYIEFKPEQRPGKMELQLVISSDLDRFRNFDVEYSIGNVPPGANLEIVNDRIEGFRRNAVQLLNNIIKISGEAPKDKDVFQYAGNIILKDTKSGETNDLAIPETTYAPPASATPVSSQYADGMVELSWVCRDANGKVPASIVVNKDAWEIPNDLGRRVGIPRYDKVTGILTQAFHSVLGDIDAVYDVGGRFQFPMPDANVYHINSTFDHKKSASATKIVELYQDGVTVNKEDMVATVFYGMRVPEGLDYRDLRVGGAVRHNDTSSSIISYNFTNDRLVVTVAISPSRIHEDFVAAFRLDITGPNARGSAETCITNEGNSSKFSIIDTAYFREGFVRFYGKGPRVDATRLGHIVKSVSNDVTNYPPTVTLDLGTGLVFIDYPVKSNEFVGRNYSVEGIIDLGDVQAPYKASLALKPIRPMFNNFILTQGGSSVDYKQGVMKVNFSVEAFGMAGIGIPQDTGIKVIATSGQFKSDGNIAYTLDPVTGKGCFLVDIHDRSVVRNPNVELKVTISSPNVGNDYNGTITGFSGQENTCEVISVRFIPNKDEIVFRCGVGYGYPTPTRPVMVNFLSPIQFAEGLENGSAPYGVEYDKTTGILEFRVKGNARPVGDVLYTGITLLGAVDSKGKTTHIPVSIYHVARDGNEARQLTEEVVSVHTYEGRSQFTIRLGYVDYLYPPTAPVISCTAPNVTIEYDKVKGLAVVTIMGNITAAQPSSLGGVVYITDELSSVNINGEPEKVTSRTPIKDSNGPEGIHQLEQRWFDEGIQFTLTARINGDKPSNVDYLSTLKTMGSNIADAVVDYNAQTGLVEVFVPASKPKFAPLSIKGILQLSANGVKQEVSIDSGLVYPVGVTHLVSCGYNKETKRVQASWVVYGKDGKYPAKVNLNTGVEWTGALNINSNKPTKEQYNPNTGIYYAEFALTQRLLGQRLAKGSTILTTGVEDVPVQFSVVI